MTVEYQGKPLTALLSAFQGLSLDSENRTDKLSIFSITHLVLF